MYNNELEMNYQTLSCKVKVCMELVHVLVCFNDVLIPPPPPLFSL